MLHKNINRRKVAETWGSMSKDKVGLYQTEKFRCTRVENVIMSDFYWLKNHKNPLEKGKKLG